MTPYSWLVGVVTARGLDVFDSLKIGGALNFVVLVGAFYGFVKRRSQHHAAPALALLLVLLLWGPRAWRYSGFLHLSALGFSLPYPSMFALGCALLAANFSRDTLVRGSSLRPIVVAAATTLVILSHPIAAMFLAAVVVSDLLTISTTTGRRAAVVAAGVAACCVALAWPFYSVLELVTSVTPGLHDENKVMYVQPWLRTFPTLTGFALAARVLWRHQRGLVLACAALAFVFVLGWLTGRWSLGRTISPAAILAQVGIALAVVDHYRPPRKVTLAAALLLLPISVAAVGAGALRLVPRSLLPTALRDRPELQGVTAPYHELERGYEGVAVTVSRNALVLPAYGIKLVALPKPHPFVPDADERRLSSKRFFAAGSGERREIAEKYEVDWVAVESPSGTCDGTSGGELRLIPVSTCY